MVHGYSIEGACVVCLGISESVCVSSDWVFFSIGFSLALSSLCFRDGLFLYAITRGSGKIRFNALLFLINFQCSLIICLSLLASSQNCVTNTNFFLLSVDFCLNRTCFLVLNLYGVVFVCVL